MPGARSSPLYCPDKTPRQTARQARRRFPLASRNRLLQLLDMATKKKKAAAKKKNPAAVELGRRGGQAKVKKGIGTLSPEERSARAKEAAAARWEKAKKGGEHGA